MMLYPAHIDGERVQPVQDHCRNTAHRASACLRPAGLAQVGYLAGLLHDQGKFTKTYAQYLERAAAGEPVRRGSVVHAHGAARFLLERFHNADAFSSYQDMTAELLAYAVGAHHGLFDCVDEQHQLGFVRRLEWDDELYQASCREFLSQCAGPAEIDALFAKAQLELEPVYGWIGGRDSNEEIFFYLGLLARLVLSAVIEGDRWDTARWMDGRPSPPPPSPDWTQLLQRVEKRLGRFSRDTPMQQARCEISQRCRQAAEQKGGLYRLHVPTGGGKTLSSLRFALAHAARNKNARIIFTSPLLSILDQNAEILRTYIGDDRLVLEHHSNVIQDKPDGGGLDPKELMCENWDAPIIITTLVQLLDTLFHGRTTCIRRFQALCRCILVIDEVQTVPTRMLTLFNLAVNFLVQVCGATVVLCSATQPCLETADHPILGSPPELVSYDPTLWAPFRRTQLLDGGTRRLEEIPDFIRARLEGTSSLLVICNLKTQARFLYRQLQQQGLACFHLSAAMCQAHRKEVLQRMQRALQASREGGPKVLCVSTQVIEAGVDVSFGSVIRLTAGMDNVIQAAGRCNRNGESADPARVYLLTCSDENLCRLREIEDAKTATLQLLSAFHRHPARFSEDLASDASITCYYKNLYGGMAQGAQDYPIKGGTSLFDLLSVNEKNAAGRPGMERFGLHQAFKQAGSAFQVFDQETTDVLVPYGKGAELINELGARAVQQEPAQQRELLKKVRPFTVSLYQFQKELLEKQGGLRAYLDGALLVLTPDFYDKETGLTPEPGNMELLEV